MLLASGFFDVVSHSWRWRAGSESRLVAVHQKNVFVAPLAVKGLDIKVVSTLCKLGLQIQMQIFVATDFIFSNQSLNHGYLMDCRPPCWTSVSPNFLKSPHFTLSKKCIKNNGP